MNYYAQNVSLKKKNVLISLNAVVDFTNASASIKAYFNYDEEAYKGFVQKAVTKRKQSEVSKVNSLISLPPKHFVVDFLRTGIQNEEFVPYLFYPVYSCKEEIYYPQMRNWMARHLSKELVDRIQIISPTCVNCATILIESNSTFQLSDFKGLYVKMNSEACPNWKAVYAILKQELNSCGV